ncbi:alpha/beta fold hydrolase [Micromonospora purpureochromogenes]|uniref:Pimeloyl-ACP methyl ester carboxylesterase n=1 Tax=Micromonospora purpureochromogenes TaxID=47872 RepID=A0ABX2RR94_9ACTN|nr:alpha/beta hydrolase [Micromonospora purpureochromogenes]NYF57671.1 pimeloyl-ACP methyl ester carboxylesterase [Micromonospora purpureochromogenes]
MAQPSFPRTRLLLALAAPVAWGLVVGWWTPRGPGGNLDAVGSVLVSLAVGLLAGWLSRSRWSMLAAPVLFALAVELVRMPLRGPTVDAPHLSGFGLGALILGRGLHGLLTLLPLLVGAAYGAGIARRTATRADRPASGDGRPATTGSEAVAGDAGDEVRPPALRRPLWSWLGRGAVGLLAAFLLLVTVAAALPARTAPIAGGVAELTTVRSGDRELGLMLRGADATAPVLLFLPGAPASSEIGAVRRHLAGLERHFVVATLDRRGAAKSWAAFAPSSTLTLDSEVADAVAVVNHLRQRFRQDKVYLMAHSGGSLVGVTAVQRHPELFRAYVGVGQAVDLRAADRSQYADTVAWARRTGRSDLARQLTDRGPPPYADMYSYEPLLANETGAFDHDRTGTSEGRDGAATNLDVPEYTLLEKAHVLGGTLDGFDVLYPQLQDLDLRREVRQLQVPVYLVDGAHEVPGRLVLARQWYAQLQAPRKEHVVLDGAGHRSLFQRPGPFVDLLTRVRAETGPPGV